MLRKKSALLDSTGRLFFIYIDRRGLVLKLCYKAQIHSSPLLPQRFSAMQDHG